MEWCAVCTINGSLLWASSTYIVDYHFLRGTLSNIYGIVAASCIFPTLNYIPSSIKSISILYDGNEAAILTFPWKIKYKRLWKSKVDKITMIMTWQRRLATWSSSSFIIISDRQISLHNARRQKYMNFPKLWAHFRLHDGYVFEQLHQMVASGRNRSDGDEFGISRFDSDLAVRLSAEILYSKNLLSHRQGVGTNIFSVSAWK